MYICINIYASIYILSPIAGAYPGHGGEHGLLYIYTHIFINIHIYI